MARHRAMSVARTEVGIDSDVYGSRSRQKRVARKCRQKHLTRKMSDGPAGSARRRTGLVR